VVGVVSGDEEEGLLGGFGKLIGQPNPAFLNKFVANFKGGTEGQSASNLNRVSHQVMMS
jgi:hypothetical protein